MKRLISFFDPFRTHPALAATWHVNTKSGTCDLIKHTSGQRNVQSGTSYRSAREIHNCSSDTNEACVLVHCGVNPVLNLVGVSGGRVWHSM